MRSFYVREAVSAMFSAQEVKSWMARPGNMNKRASALKVASLFSGCGGLDLGATGGFEFMGRKYPANNVKIVFANDIDPDAANCYNSNVLHQGAACRLGDIREIPMEEIPDFDILLGGFPCQPFSNAGNRKGVHDNNGRGTLFEMCENVLKSKIDKAKNCKCEVPKAFVFENVRGILSSRMPDGTTVPDEIKKRMERLGYAISTHLVCASNFGVPQERYRVLIVGVRKDIASSFDILPFMERIVKDKKMPSKEYGTREELLLGTVLKELPKDGEAAYWPYSKTTQTMVENIGPCKSGKRDLKLFDKGFKIGNLPSRVFEGKSWKDVPPELLSPRFRKIYDNPKKYHAPKFFRRFALGEINGTLTASAQPENCGITHPYENRRFSVREAARIQSFPDNFSFMSIPLQSRYKVIGNAVPPVLGWVVINALISILKGAE